MDDQQYYELVREYFSRPGAKLARTDDAKCWYRMADGSKCAFGCAIPDRLYRPEMDDGGGMAADQALSVYSDLSEYFIGVNQNFIQTAQSAHDCHAKDVADFIRLLDRIAKDYGLKVVK